LNSSAFKTKKKKHYRKAIVDGEGDVFLAIPRGCGLWRLLTIFREECASIALLIFPEVTYSSEDLDPQRSNALYFRKQDHLYYTFLSSMRVGCYKVKCLQFFFFWYMREFNVQKITSSSLAREDLDR